MSFPPSFSLIFSQRTGFFRCHWKSEVKVERDQPEHGQPPIAPPPVPPAAGPTIVPTPNTMFFPPPGSLPASAFEKELEKQRAATFEKLQSAGAGLQNPGSSEAYWQERMQEAQQQEMHYAEVAAQQLQTAESAEEIQQERQETKQRPFQPNTESNTVLQQEEEQMLQRHAKERAQHEEQHELVRNKLRAAQASCSTQQSELDTCHQYQQKLQTEIENLKKDLQHAENSQQQQLLSNMEGLMVNLNMQTSATSEALSELTEREKRLLTRNEKYDAHRQSMEKKRHQELQTLVKEFQRTQQNKAAVQQQRQAPQTGRFAALDAVLSASRDSRKQVPHLPPAPSAPAALRTQLTEKSATPDGNNKLRQQLLEQEEQTYQEQLRLEKALQEQEQHRQRLQQQLQEHHAQQELQTAELQQQHHHEQQSYQAFLKQQMEAEHAQMKAAAEKKLQEEMAELEKQTQQRLAEEEKQMQAAAQLNFEQQQAELQSLEQRVAQQRHEMEAARQSLPGVKNKMDPAETSTSGAATKKPRLGEIPFQPGPVSSGYFWTKPLQPGLLEGPRTPQSPDPSPEPPRPNTSAQLAATPKFKAKPPLPQTPQSQAPESLQPPQTPALALAQPGQEGLQPLVQKKTLFDRIAGNKKTVSETCFVSEFSLLQNSRI